MCGFADRSLARRPRKKPSLPPIGTPVPQLVVILVVIVAVTSHTLVSSVWTPGSATASAHALVVAEPSGARPGTSALGRQVTGTGGRGMVMVTASRAQTLDLPVPQVNWGPDIPWPTCGAIGPISLPADVCQLACQSVLAVYGFITMVVAVYVAQDLVLPLVDPADRDNNFLLGTPPAFSYANSGVILLYSTVSLPLALLFISLIVAWGGITMMVRPQLGLSYHTVMEFLPRVLLGVGLAAFGISGAPTVGAVTGWISGLIQLINAVDQTIPNPVITVSTGQWPDLADHPTAAGIIFAAFAAGETILLIAVLWQLLVRVALIDVLIVCAPLAMMCWIPHSAALLKQFCEFC